MTHAVFAIDSRQRVSEAGPVELVGCVFVVQLCWRCCELDTKNPQTGMA